MSATPGDPGRVDLRRRRIIPRRLGAAAVVYGVFVAGWYLGQPVTPECRPEGAAPDRAAERYGHVPVSTPAPVAGPAAEPSAIARHSPIETTDTVHILTATVYAVPCGNDTGELPRLAAWFDGTWR